MGGAIAVKLIAEQVFPAFAGKGPGAVVLRDMGGDGGLRFATHWRDGGAGGYVDGRHMPEPGRALQDFDARVGRQMREIARRNPSPRPTLDDGADLDRAEAAEQAGMAFGTAGRNEVLGEDVEDAPAFGPR